MPQLDPNEPLCENTNITVSGIEKLLKQLNPTKASGPEDISPRVLKEVATEIVPSLTLIYKASLKSGIVPKDRKAAQVAPVLKKGESHKPNIYRPISLTSIHCKLMGYVEEHQILCPAFAEADPASPSCWGSWTKCLKCSTKDAKKMC